MLVAKLRAAHSNKHRVVVAQPDIEVTYVIGVHEIVVKIAVFTGPKASCAGRG